MILDLVAIARALSDDGRVRALVQLRQNDELCACQIVDLLRLTPATISRHMAVLLESGLLTSTKRGRWVYYAISPSVDARFWDWFDALVENDPKIKLDAANLPVQRTACRGH